MTTMVSDRAAGLARVAGNGLLGDQELTAQPTGPLRSEIGQASRGSVPGEDRPVRRRRPATLFPLAAVLLLQLMAMLTLRNSAFQDEALYLFAGRDLWRSWTSGEPALENYASYFSGLPQLYPVFAGWLDRLGGAELARTASMVCALWITCAAYLIGRTMFGRRAGLAGAAVLAVQGSLLFIGRLATFDAMCLALLALAALLAVRTGVQLWWRIPVVAAICLVAALTKYAGAAFVPMIIVLLLGRVHWSKRRLVEALAGGLLALGLAGGAALVLWRLTPDLFTGLDHTTTNRQVQAILPRSELVRRIVISAGAGIVLAALGFSLFWRRRTRAAGRLLAVAMMATLLIAPTYHVIKGEVVSMDKHLAYGLFFAAPLIGYACNTVLTVVGRVSWKSRIVGVAAITMLFGLGLQQAGTLYSVWPNSTSMVQTLRQVVRSNNTHILAEEFEVPRYYLSDQATSGWEFTGLDYLRYQLPDGSYLEGPEAYRRAIDDGYFGVVVLRYGSKAALANELTDRMLESGHYRQIAMVPFASGQGAYRIFRVEVSR
ncbi:DUF3824 domain-containing protein [Microlunatus panaciterrae]|uniref:Glycosyltransferase RgtA/B/C/D-like domain-containing protein n=1 Tax=Microlunatus panaciterrae TaxID=400768 RepID=A0ABS2RIM2_9ACTN|nr:glycosyltransferase family 39 protein [Microlunatus panaciterrae]MBM7798563.1 hypothetical protein [Microlunatus panaciterrae]